MAVTLCPVAMHWIRDAADDPEDLCAHGSVEFRIDADVLADGTAGREWTVSATALYLLRTLSAAHTKAAPVGDHLFPCCGFAMFDVGTQEDVLVVGCPGGDDFEVAHLEGGAGVLVRSPAGKEWHIGWPEWRAAVFAFADQVSAFYAGCAPKQPTADDEPGFRKFVAEWQRRRGQPLGREGTQQPGLSPVGPGRAHWVPAHGSRDPGHPHRWRTWLRTRLPRFLVALGIAAKGRDCERVGGWHRWYDKDGKSSGCHHCEVVRPGQWWHVDEA